MSALARSIAAARLASPWHALRFALGIAVAATGAVLLVADLAAAVAATPPLRAALAGGLLAGAATALGALPVLFMRRGVAAGTRDAMLGFGAGVMLAASAFSLVVPAVAAGADIVGSRKLAALLAGGALALGVAAMFAVERIVPHVHDEAAERGGIDARAVWLMVFAILIHNFPEGLAVGAAFSGTDPAQGWPVAFAIAVQDIPEGLVVALALRAIGHDAARAAAIGAATGLAEPAGALASAFVVAAAPPLYPAALAAAAGAMLFVVSHEIIPGIHRRGHEATATLGVTAGFVAMMILDNAFAG